MEEYRPNSNKYKQEQKETTEKRATKIITGPVTTKKSSSQTFMGKFIVEDLKTVASNVATNTLIPGIKRVLYDMFTGGLNSILFGGKGAPTVPGTTVAGRVAYRDFYSGAQYQAPTAAPRAATAYDYNQIIFATRTDAVDVLTRMDELIAKYRVVRVADLYDLVGMSGNYTDNRYGWTNLSSAEVIPVSGGYMIRMPNALPIE